MPPPSPGRLRRALTSVALAATFVLATQAQEAVKSSFDLPADAAEKSLRRFSQQSGLEVLFPSELARGVRTKAVKGEMSPASALGALLEGTGLEVFRDDRSGAFTVRKAGGGNGAEAKNAPRAVAKNSDRPSAKTESSEEKTLELPTFEVMGSKLLNMDIRRSRDDAQPYVVFERESIEYSGATNLEDFLRTRLTMNTVSRASGQVGGSNGNSSTVNLRGIGANQTLILVDGRRLAAKIGSGANPDQPDINGIPLSAIERVEVLPTTASGIYGGAATGGVINIILRRDYAGAEIKATYGNTFSSDAMIAKADLSVGVNLEGGKTNVLLAATWSTSNALALQDRPFFTEGRARVLANNPASFLNAATPPLGRTPNIRSVNGSPLFGPGSSNITFVPEGYAGGGGLTPFLANAGKYNFRLAQNANTSAGGRRNLVNNPDIASLSLTARRQISPTLQGFLEAATSRNQGRFLNNSLNTTATVASTAPNNPFGQAVRVTFPAAQGDQDFTVRNDNSRIVAGFTAKLPWQDWLATADFSWQQATVEWQSSPFLSGTQAAEISSGGIDVLRDVNLFPADLSPHLVTLSFGPRRSTIYTGSIRVAGPLGRLPAGLPTVSALIDYRDEYYGTSNQRSFTAAGTPHVPFSFFNPSRSQVLYAGYVETKLPLVAETQHLRFLRQAELQIAVRYDEFKINGATGFLTTGSTSPVIKASNKDRSTNPTLGLRVMPAKDVMLRGSYGTGFLPPNPGQLTPNQPFLTSSALLDPRRGNTVVGTVTQTTGGNPNLRPEESESWSAGLVITPRIVPGLRASIDWTRIKKTDNIAAGLESARLLENEALFPGRLTRGANLPTDPAGWAGPITAWDLTAINLASGEVEAWDASLDYTSSSANWGALGFYAVATWTAHFKTQATPVAAVVESAGIGSDPLRFKANGGLTWKRGAWSLGWNAQHFKSYQVVANPATTGATVALNQGGLRVPSQTYHDVFVSYRWTALQKEGWLAFLANSELRVGVRNVLNKRPPFDAGVATDYYSRYGDPRMANYEISLKRLF